MNIEIDSYYVMYNLLKKIPYKNCLQDLHKQLVNKIKNKSKIKIAFQTSSLPVWPCQKLVYLFRNNSRFDVKIIIAWQYNTDRGKKIGDLIEYFDQYDMPYCIADGNIHPKDFDIIFYTSPYLFGLPEWNDKDVMLNSLVCYIPYGFNVADIQDVQFNLFIHNICWKQYVATPYYLSMADKYCEIGSYGMVASGYPKLDDLLNQDCANEAHWKIASDNTDTKKIIYAPHHSINEAPYHSTFPLNYRYILEYAKTHQDSTSWIFKPHPLLGISCVRNGIFKDKSEWDAYCQEWENLPNARYIDSLYMPWFASSDCMIFDSMSFMAEYLYTGKPSLFLTRKSGHFNEFGRKIFNILYKTEGNNLGAIRNFIENLSVQDPQKNLREDFFDKYLDYYNNNGQKDAATYIYEDILKELEI